ncbi:MAG: hypothetical protein D6711_02625 [Chloroflexi bacterium]|nr:MAG: hypothetical protein D6711_02625 [Chloroflexota bacterium]
MQQDTPQLILPSLYPLQAEILEHPAQRKVVVAGRRAGKTTLGAVAAAQQLLLGKRILITSTTQDQADAFWDKLKEWFADWLLVGAIVKHESRRLLTHRDSGGRVRVKTGRHPDTLRGDDADLIIFDECALLDPATWYAVAAPMLADRDGKALFISTPRAKNWFFHLYQRALDPINQPRWMAWRFPTHANPYLSPQAVAYLKDEMPTDLYRQEILAEFLDNVGSVFRRITANVADTLRAPYPGTFIGGLDWARSNDFTVLILLDADTRHVVAYDRFQGVDWATQRQRILRLYQQWRPQRIIAEANSIGGPNIEALQDAGLPIFPFTMGGYNKSPLIESLALAFEQGEITIPNDAVLIGELEAYERTINRYTGRSSYAAPLGMHDDMVIALALAWYGLSHQRRHRLIITENPFY